MTIKTLSAYFVIILFFTGCSRAKLDGLVPVSGTVTYKGEPLADASVGFVPLAFESGNRIGTGMTDAEGHFTLRTIGELGVLPDEYGVMIIKNIELGEAKQPQKGGPPQRQRKKIKSAIPVHYNAAKTSGLTFRIGKEGETDLKIALED